MSMLFPPSTGLSAAQAQASATAAQNAKTAAETAATLAQDAKAVVAAALSSGAVGRVGAGDKAAVAAAIVDARGRGLLQVDTAGATNVKALRVGLDGPTVTAATGRENGVWLSNEDGKGRSTMGLTDNGVAASDVRLERAPSGGWEMGRRGGAAFAAFAEGTANIAGVSLRGASIPGVALAIEDSRGRLYNAIPAAAVAPVAPVVVDTEVYGYRADTWHIAGLGQSWIGGTNGTPPVSTTATPGIFMLAGGVRPRDNSSDPAVIYSSLVPAVETVNTAGTRGETPLSGIAQQFMELAGADVVGPAQCQVVISAVGNGGATLAEISPGSTSFTETITQARAVYDLSQAAGRSYCLAGVHTMIGKGDYDAGEVDRVVYRDRLLALQAGLTAAVRAFIPGHDEVKLFLYQTMAFTHMGRAPSVELAIADAAAASPHVINVSPLYTSDAAAGDTVHYPAAGYKRFGAQGGVANHLARIKGTKVNSLTVLRAVRQGRIVVAMLDPVGQLVIDTAAVSDPGNYGFQLVDATGTSLPITSVSLGAPGCVNVLAAGPVPAGAKLRTAWQGTGTGIGRVYGPRTSIRDSRGSTLVLAAGGFNYPVHRHLGLTETLIT